MVLKNYFGIILFVYGCGSNKRISNQNKNKDSNSLNDIETEDSLVKLIEEPANFTDKDSHLNKTNKQDTVKISQREDNLSKKNEKPVNSTNKKPLDKNPKLQINEESEKLCRNIYDNFKTSVENDEYYVSDKIFLTNFIKLICSTSSLFGRDNVDRIFHSLHKIKSFLSRISALYGENEIHSFILQDFKSPKHTIPGLEHGEIQIYEIDLNKKLEILLKMQRILFDSVHQYNSNILDIFRSLNEKEKEVESYYILSMIRDFRKESFGNAGDIESIRFLNKIWMEIPCFKRKNEI